MKTKAIFTCTVLGIILLCSCGNKSTQNSSLADSATASTKDSARVSGIPCDITLPKIHFTKAVNGADTLAKADKNGKVTFRVGEKKDFFCGPNNKLSNNTAPILLAKVDNTRPFTFVSKVTSGFTKEGLYNAGVLYIYVNDNHWQKFCFEQDERGNHRIVTVRTIGTSDDNNHAEKNSDDVFNQLYRESLFKAFTVITRFGSLIDSGDLTVQTETFRRLLNKVLTASNIPFHGEPAIGMQVMGVLETRNLDFKNLVMMSLNEGQLPKGSGDSSFIPYNLRKAFGMTTIEHKNAVYAYYFYRLIQRAENITLMYNTSSDGLNRGEWSRFMLQFLIEWPHDISREYIEAGQSPQVPVEITIQKTPDVMKRLQNFYDIRSNKKAQFSPSALNTYMDCRLKFYYTYVAALRPKPEVSPEIDSAMFGTIFHRSAELIYGDFKAHGGVVNKDQIEQLLHNDVKLQGYVDRAFKEEFFQVPLDEKPEYNGVQLVNSKVIVSYLRQLLRNDKEYAPFTLVDMEKKVSEDISIPTAKGDILSRIGGTIDRMDSKDGTLRIVDYKTGGTPKAAADIAALFTPAENRPSYIFQTFLYAAIMTRQQKLKVAPSLLYIHQAASADYKPYIEIGQRNKKTFVEDFTPYEEEFRESMTQLLGEIFNPEEPFSQTKFVSKCEYCDFKAMCKR